MNRHALAYPLAAGADQSAVAVAREWTWPMKGWESGSRLLACTVFHQPGLLIRFLDVEGELDPCLRALARDESVRRCEARLARWLADPPAGDPDIEELHRRLALPWIAGRFTDPALLPAGHQVRTSRAALLYPVRPGQGQAVREALTGGRGLQVRATESTALASTAVFGSGDLVVRLVEVAGDLAAGFAHLRTTASRSPVAGRLAALLQPGNDLRSEEGFARFLATAAMAMVSDDRADHPGLAPIDQRGGPISDRNR